NPLQGFQRSHVVAILSTVVQNTSIGYSRFVAGRTQQLGLKLRDLAAAASSRGVTVDHTVLWRVMKGERQSLPDTYPDRLDQVIALGERTGASRPVYVFGHIAQGRSGHFSPIFDDAGRIGFMDWRSRGLARDIGEMLREVPGWRNLHAVPAWPSWLVDQEAEGHAALQL